MKVGLDTLFGDYFFFQSSVAVSNLCFELNSFIQDDCFCGNTL